MLKKKKVFKHVKKKACGTLVFTDEQGLTGACVFAAGEQRGE